MPSKKRIYISFCILFLALLFIFITGIVKRDQIAFGHYVKQFNKTELENNALNLHYTLKNSEGYGIYSQNTLPVYIPDSALSTFDYLQDKQNKLSQIDMSALSEKDAFTYEILYDYLSENMELEKYPYLSEPLTPNSGIHTTLPILLAEYTFYEEEDVENYLELLTSVPAYLSSMAVYEKEKAEAGLFMNVTALDKVVTACEEFGNPENLDSHLLVTSFKERLNELSETTQGLSPEKIDSYTLENTGIVKNEILPAYTELAKKLTDLSQYAPSEYSGLFSYENGKEYYQALLKRNTGSYRSISDIKELIYADFELSYISLLSLLSTNPELLESDCFSTFDLGFPLKDGKAILEHLQTSMNDDFPLLDTDTQISVKAVSESLQDYCSPAFYLTVPIDSYEKNVIYLNEKDSLEGLSLYTTLAHEGFPGHLYQTVYFHSVNDIGVTDHSALLRNLLYFGGYTEGYALYVEDLSYTYATNACTDAGLTDAELICKALQYEWKMQISLYCLLDIAIHYDGASYEQIQSILNSFGVIDESSQRAVYQYLLEEPTTYLKYYLGYLEIKSLKSLAKNLWGDTYSDLRFHTFLLEAGPCNFKLLEKRLLEEAIE